MQKILEINDLCFHYQNNIDILHNITLQVNAGDFIGIFGDNGAGKSTLIKLLLGQLKPCQGEVNWLSTHVRNFSDWNIVGYVPQRTIMSNDRFPATVEEVVMANLYKDIGMFKFPSKKHKEKVKKALELTKMDKYAKRQIGKLSGGQMQRVYIARALVNSPEILILDEPTSGVDNQTIDKLFEILKELNERDNITIIMITHDINKAFKYLSRAYKIVDGRLREINGYNN